MADNEHTESISEWPIDTYYEQKPRHIPEGKRSTSRIANNSCPYSLLKASNDLIENWLDKIISSSVDISAKYLLAKWWKLTSDKHHEKYHMNSSLMKLAPTSKIFRIAELPEAKVFLALCIKTFKTYLKNDKVTNSRKSHLYMCISWCHERLNHYNEALHHLEQALVFVPNDNELIWNITRVQRQLSILSTQNFINSNATILSTQKLITVSRVSANDLSLEDFFTNFALKHIPVIITDLAWSLTRERWTLDHIKHIAGASHVIPKILNKDSVEWAKLESTKTTTVSEFIENLKSGNNTDQSCIFDWSLYQHCPDLASELTIPKYFANDFLQRIEKGSLYRDSWPSLFISPSGAVSDLHIDAFSSNFWMALLQGQKRWTFYPKEDTAFLYPKYYDSMDPVFCSDLSNPDLSEHPLLGHARSFQCNLHEGEILFVPFGCPHRVENLQTSVAISANYVDESNFEDVLRDLKVQGLIDSRADDLYKQFSCVNFNTKMYMDLKHLLWDDFKNCSFMKD